MTKIDLDIFLKLISEETKRLKKKKKAVSAPILRRPMGSFFSMDAVVGESDSAPLNESDVSYFKPDVIKGSIFDVSRVGPTAIEMGITDKKPVRNPNLKTIQPNQNPHFRKMTPGEAIYKHNNGETGGLTRSKTTEVPDYMYEWLMYFLEGSCDMKVKDSKIMNEFHAPILGKPHYVMFSFENPLKKSGAHPYDLASNTTLSSLKEFYSKVNEFNETFKTHFRVTNQYIGDDEQLKVVLENVELEKKMFDFSVTDISRMIELGVYEATSRSIT